MAHPQCTLTPRQLASHETKIDRTITPDGDHPWVAALDKRGYGQIGINGKTLKAHRVAWEIVAGPIPEGLHVLHTCDNPACCRNDDEGTYEVNGVLFPRRGHLWLGTNADNTADKIAKGRQSAGDRHGSRLHPERVARGDRHGAHTHPERIARGDRHGTRTHPERIARGDRHKSQTQPDRVFRGARVGNALLTDDKVREIRRLLDSGQATQRALALRYGVGQVTISHVFLRHTWKHVTDD